MAVRESLSKNCLCVVILSFYLEAMQYTMLKCCVLSFSASLELVFL